jgi:integrase
MTNALRTVARLLTGCAGLCKCERCNPFAVPWHELGREHTQGIRSLLAETRSPATCNLAIAGLRGVLRESWRLGLMTAEAHARAGDLKRVRSSSLPKGRMLTRAELVKLFAAIDTSTDIGARDAGIFAVARVGLRRAELVGLDGADYQRDGAGALLRVRNGKGRKQRAVPMPAHLAAHVDRWLTVRGDAPGPLFFASDGAGHGLTERRPSTTAIYLLCERYARRAGLAAFAPHDLRRTMISELLDAGADLSSVQKIAGHSDVSTTQRYDRRDERAMVSAVALLS